MQLNLTKSGTISADYPKTFYRVSTWNTGAYVADYTTKADAVKASYASANGTKYDHKVSAMHLN